MIHLANTSPPPILRPRRSPTRQGQRWRAWDKGLGQLFCQTAVIITHLVILLSWLQPGAYAGDPHLTYVVPMFTSLGLFSLLLPVLWVGATLIANLWDWLDTPAGARVTRLVGQQLPRRAPDLPPPRLTHAPHEARRRHTRRPSTRLPFALFGYAPLLAAP